MASVMLAIGLTSCDDIFPKDQPDTSKFPYKFIEGFKDKIEYPTSRDLTNWMAELPDNKKVCKLSIPGTHDALTGMGFYSKDFKLIQGVFAISQVSTYKQQLDQGIRFFDIRPVVGTDTITHTKVLRCAHGPSELDITFDEALDQTINFLHEHKKEFVIMKIQHDNGSEDQMQWIPMMVALMNSEPYSDYIVDWKPDITVGEMRGKILLINRLEFTGMQGACCAWPDEDPDIDENVYYDQERSRVIYDCDNPDVKTGMWVQDYYKVTTEKRQNTKREAVLRMLDDSRALAKKPEDNTWVVNHCSAYTFPSANGYVTNAEVVHKAVVDNILANPEKFVGMIAMDFSCYDNVDCIVNGGSAYVSLYLFDRKPLSQSMTNLIIENNFK